MTKCKHCKKEIIQCDDKSWVHRFGGYVCQSPNIAEPEEEGK